MQISSGQHLSFCLNVFALDDLEKIFAVLANECQSIKSQVSEKQPMGLGLWLSAQVADELQDEEKLKSLQVQLTKFDFYVFTLNIFPYGNFHESPVKEKVYYPDWGDQKRLDYTCKAAEILAKLCPDEYGTMSTVPVTFGKELPLEAVDTIRQCSQYLQALESRTGVKIELAFEPEPDCYLETCDEALRFFEELRSQLTKGEMEYLGVCLDTCHSALQYEDPIENLEKYVNAAVKVSKVQISAAPVIMCGSDSDKEILRPFAEPVYLHQTRVKDSEGLVTFYKDLPEALLNGDAGEWRCHFHIPLHFTGNGVLQSTNKDLSRSFFALAQKHCRHFETETYTYFVLPNASESVSDSISQELMWVKERL